MTNFGYVATILDTVFLVSAKCFNAKTIPTKLSRPHPILGYITHPLPSPPTVADSSFNFAVTLGSPILV